MAQQALVSHIHASGGIRTRNPSKHTHVLGIAATRIGENASMLHLYVHCMSCLKLP